MYIQGKVDKVVVIDLLIQKKLSGTGNDTNKKQIVLFHKAPSPSKRLYSLEKLEVKHYLKTGRLTKDLSAVEKLDP